MYGVERRGRGCHDVNDAATTAAADDGDANKDDAVCHRVCQQPEADAGVREVPGAAGQDDEDAGGL